MIKQLINKPGDFGKVAVASILKFKQDYDAN